MGRNSAMAIVERYTSPDKSMVLLVDSTAGDWTIGFDGYPWHTHGDILDAWGYEGSPEGHNACFLSMTLFSH